MVDSGAHLLLARPQMAVIKQFMWQIKGVHLVYMYMYLDCIGRGGGGELEKCPFKRT